jgi:hypothetical protein
MKKILLGLFKRWICFIPACLMWFLSHPINIMLVFIPQLIYWTITGRGFMEDGNNFINWVLNN